MNNAHTGTETGSQRQRGRPLRWSLVWPLVTTCLALALVLAGFILDTLSERGRDLALVVGGPALTVLLPLSVVWLIVALVMRWRQRKA